MTDKRDYTEQGAQVSGAAFRGVWNNVLQPIVSNQGAPLFGTVVEWVANPFTRNAKVAKKLGGQAEKAFSFSSKISANVSDFVKATKDSRADFKALQTGVRPFLIEEFGKSGMGKLMRSENEVVSHERSRIMNRAKSRFYSAGSGLADKIPELYAVALEKRKAIDAGGDGFVLGDREQEEQDAEKVETHVDRAVRGAEQRLNQFVRTSFFDKENTEKNKMLLDMAFRTGAPAMQHYIAQEGEKKFGSVSAYSMIKVLEEMAHSGKGNINHVTHPRTKASMSLEKYVLEIFKQNQADNGAVPLNDRSPALPELKDACKRIADEIQNNLLDPMALVSLVGDRKILDKHLRVADSEQVDAELKQIWRVIEKSQDIDAQAFIEETAFATKEDFQSILQELPPGEKAFFASLFPDVVLKDIGGLKDAEIDELKEQGGRDFSLHLEDAIGVLGRLDAKELQHYGLTPEEGKLMRDLAKAIDRSGAEEALGELQEQARHEVTEAVRNARGYWQELVSKGSPRERAAATEAERITASAADPAGPAEPLSKDERARLEYLEQQFSESHASRHVKKDTSPDTEKGEKKYADAVSRGRDAQEQHTR